MQKPVRLYSEGSAKNNTLLGNKGANLFEMTALDHPIQSEFIIAVENCFDYNRLGEKLPDDFMDKVMSAITEIETCLGKFYQILKIRYWFLFSPEPRFQ